MILRNVDLVDREAVKFPAHRELSGVAFLNCPQYILEP